MADPQLNIGAFVNTGAGSSSSLTLTFPTTFNGGTAIALMMGHGSSGGTPPGSWTTIGDGQTVVSGGSSRLTHLQLATDGTEGGTTQTFTFSGSERRVGVIIATDGTIEQVSTGGFSASATSINHDAVTTTNDNSALLYIETGLESSPILTDYAVAQTELGEDATAAGSNDVVLAVGWESFPTADTSTVRTSTGPADAAATLGQKTLSVYVSGGGSTLHKIVSTSTDSAGATGTMDITNGDLVAASVVALDFDSETLSITVQDTDTLEYTLPDGGHQLGADLDHTLTIDGVDSDPYTITFDPPSGMTFSNLTSNYGSLDSDSFLAKALLTTLAIPDQIVHDILDSQGGALTFDPATGLMSTTSATNVDKTFNYYIQDASDSYNEGSTGTATIYASVPVMAADTSATPDEGTTAVGTYAVTNTSNPNVVYSLSGTDADDFNINSSTGAVTAKVAYDYETKSTYEITVTATLPEGSDSQNITINVQNVNEPPTDISLSSTSVAIDAGTNAPVATVSVTDEDSGDSHTITLVAGSGDTDNASFSIHADGVTLLCNDPAALGEGPRNIRLQADDGVSTPFSKAFVITVYTPSETTGALIISPVRSCIGRLVKSLYN